MSGKLDQSLDEILSSTRRTAGRGGKTAVARRRSRTSKPTVPAPKAAVKPIPTGPSGGSGESKIMISNLVSQDMVHVRFPRTNSRLA
jgi:THO complex subunit 4